jgi:large subunit ribosomal protein L25
VLEIKIGKKTEKGILKDLQRHPAKPLLLHFDILRVKAGEKLKTKVPVHFINEDTCVGVKAGGVVSHNVTELEIECLPKNLPEYIEVDLANVEIGHAVHLSELQLPTGVELVNHGELDAAHDQPVASVNEPKKVVVEDDAPEAPAEVPVGDEGKEEEAGEE